MKYLLIISFLLLSACGKEGLPIPLLEEQSFYFTDEKVLLYNNCILVQTTITGNYSAINSIYLELQPVMEDKTVFTCPFIPTIVEKASNSFIKNLSTNKSITIQYCPTVLPKGGYRFRLRGNHYLFRIPTVYSPLSFISTVAKGK